MLKNSLIVCLILLFAAPVFAQWDWVKNIDVSNPGTDLAADGARIKAIDNDADGNLYFTTQFGTATRRIWKVTDPLSATPTMGAFETPAADYSSLNGVDLCVDSTGKVYFEVDPGYDTSYVNVYLASGALDTSVGGGDGIIGPPITVNSVNKAPRSIWHVEGDDVILMGCWEANPTQIIAIDGTTGADYGNIDTLTCNDGDDVVDDADSQAFGIAYDPVDEAIYYNAFCDLIKVTSSTTADITDITTFDTYEVVGDNPRDADTAIGLDFDPDSRKIAFTAREGAAGAEYIDIYDIATDTIEATLGAESGLDGYMNVGGAPAIYTVDGITYVAALDYYTYEIEIWVNTGTAVENWNLFE